MDIQQRFSLRGQRALVIGGGTGIGRAIALGLAGAGAEVHLSGRRLEVLEGTAAELRALGVQSRAYPADASDMDALGWLVEQVESSVGLPDILVNAQGVMQLAAAEDFEPDDYDRVMDTNARSVWFASTRFGRRMLARGSGCVISVASLAAHRGFQRNGVYCLSKHAVKAMTETLAAEWAGRGVRVNAISPGFFMTDLNKDAMGEERKARALARTPMGRFGELDELAGAAVFLASPAASYVTGVTLPVDGGFLAAGM